MKKNKMMRIASVLLVAVLISTCAISGTFAKYVTKMTGEDGARVAKWGIVLTLDAGDVFASEYKTHDAAALEAGIEVSVQAAVAAADTEGDGTATTEEEADKLVAPGTSSADINGSIKASVAGTPEVATRYTLTIEGLKDVFLKKGTYTDYTQLVKGNDGKYGYTGTFTLDADYAPIKWDLKIGEGENATSLAAALMSAFSSNADQLAAYGMTADGVSFHDAAVIIGKINSNTTYKQAVENFLKEKIDGANFQITVDDAGTITISYDVKPNVEVKYTAELVWKWAFEQVTPAGTTMTEAEAAALAKFDAADTLLGNLACDDFTYAGESTLTEDTDYSVKIEAKLTATATQID